jgi:hypothetical protein
MWTHASSEVRRVRSISGNKLRSDQTQQLKAYQNNAPMGERQEQGRGRKKEKREGKGIRTERGGRGKRTERGRGGEKGGGVCSRINSICVDNYTYQSSTSKVTYYFHARLTLGYLPRVQPVLGNQRTATKPIQYNTPTPRTNNLHALIDSPRALRRQST